MRPTANVDVSAESTRQNAGVLNSSKKILWMRAEDARVMVAGGNESRVTDALLERTTGSKKERTWYLLGAQIRIRLR